MKRKAKDPSDSAKRGEEPAKNNRADRKTSEINLKVPFMAVPPKHTVPTNYIILKRHLIAVNGNT
ncbi:hypothetical protein KAJ77_08930 [bacterium]|nr:hypothetical protein [bacterium]